MPSPSPNSTKRKKTCEQVMYPLFGYMLAIGLCYKPIGNRGHQKIFMLYNWATVIIMIALCIRRLILIKTLWLMLNSQQQSNIYTFQSDLLSAIFSVKSAVMITKTIYQFCACLATLSLFFLQLHLSAICEALDREADTYDSDNHRKRYMLRMSFTMAAASLILSIMSVAIVIGSYHGYIDLPWIQPLISTEMPYLLLDVYEAFISQSAIMILAAIFGNFCIVLCCKAERLAEDMAGDDHPDSCPTKETAYTIVYNAQRRYQALQDANRLLEQHFSLALFVVYSSAIPIICFLLYAMLHTATLQPVILYWICMCTGLLLYYSIPAFKVQEGGEKVIGSCFKMYHQHLCQQRDTGLLTAILFFVFQIQSSPLSLTAGNFFSLKRSVVLTLFSAIVTYFIVLMQFDLHPASSGQSIGPTA